jgi:hypothetical protein
MLNSKNLSIYFHLPFHLQPFSIQYNQKCLVHYFYQFTQSSEPFTFEPSMAICYTIHSILLAIFFQFWPFAIQTFNPPMQPYSFNPPSHFPAILLAIFYTVHSILPCSHMHSILLAIFFQFWPFATQYIQFSLAAIFIQFF